MGELILCCQKLAAQPYYIDNAALGVYSLEELSYYIGNNLYLLEQNFISEELCVWIDQELGMNQTAEKLRNICKTGGGMSEFVLCILSQSGYYTVQEVKHIAETLREMESKSEYECCKIRADRYMQKQKYVSAIYEYRKLLREEEANPIVTGNVWHNLGTAYARLFLFGEAADCYQKAYERNENPESLREWLYACRCRGDKSGFSQIAKESGLTAEETAKIAGNLTATSRGEAIREFEEKLKTLFLEEREEEICGLIEEWKDTYRKNCRI